jgi:hypothetical protein
MTATGDRRPATGDRRTPHAARRTLLRDTRGQAALETILALLVIIPLTEVIIEFSLISNAKQLANYAAFCAAREVSVYGATATQKAQQAAAMAMTPISPRIPQDAVTILSAFGLPNPGQTIQTICAIPGMQDSAQWSSRLADAYVRMAPPVCSTSTSPGLTRQHVVVNVTFIYRCSVFPFGSFFGHTGLNAYITYLQGLSFYNTISPVVTTIQSQWPWNVPVHGRAVLDYWAG